MSSVNRTRLVLGLLVAGLVGSFVLAAARDARRRMFPRCIGEEALLIDVVLVVALVTVVANVNGTIGWFAPWPMVASLMVASILIWLSARFSAGGRARSRPWGDTVRDGPTTASHAGATGAVEPGWVRTITLVVLAIVGAGWVVTLAAALGHGIDEWDSVWYHLPAASDFVRSGSFLPLHLYSADIAPSTYPMGSEVFHALGMLVAGSDILGPFANLGWAVIALLAARVLGRRHGVANLATLALVCVLATPIALWLSSATAQGEMMAIAFLVAAMALTVPTGERRERRARLFVIGLSVGLVASTKFTMLLPALLLAVASVVTVTRPATARRTRASVPVLVGAAATGAYWYVRNWWRFGSPLPEWAVHLGPIRLGHVEVAGDLGPMLPTLVDGLRSNALESVLDFWLGQLWIVFLLAPVVALGVAVAARRSGLVVFAVVGVLAFFGGTLTPQYLRAGVYQTLGPNMRYLLAGIVISLLVIACSAGSRRAAGATAAGMTVVAGLSVYDWRSLSIPMYSEGIVGRTGLIVAMIVVLAGAVALRSHPRAPLARRRMGGPVPAVGVLVAVVAVVTVWALPSYLANRSRLSRTDYVGVSAPSVDRVFAWAAGVHDQRIGVAPYDFADWIARGPAETARGHQALLFTYGFEGVDRSNRVEPIADFDGRRVVPPTSCADWWRRLQAMDADYVILWVPPTGADPAATRRLAWTEASVATRLAVRVPLGPTPPAHLAVYEVDAHRPPTC